MKFTAVLTFIAAATVVSAATNAERLARGLGPNAPGKRATPVAAARRGSPSGTSECSTGSQQCCQSVQTAGSGGSADDFLSSMGILGTLTGIPVGVNCSPLTVVGGGTGASCTQQTVCCTGNSFSGIVNVGCSPINVNL